MRKLETTARISPKFCIGAYVFALFNKSIIWRIIKNKSTESGNRKKSKTQFNEPFQGVFNGGLGSVVDLSPGNFFSIIATDRQSSCTINWKNDHVCLNRSGFRVFGARYCKFLSWIAINFTSNYSKFEKHQEKRCPFSDRFCDQKGSLLVCNIVSWNVWNNLWHDQNPGM